MSTKPLSPFLEESELIEVVDEYNRPLAVLPREKAHQQNLRHRSVMVLIYDSHGKLYLQKRSENKYLYPGRWDISVAGHVLAGESLQDAAFRELREELNIAPYGLTKRHFVPASMHTGFEFVTLFAVNGYDGTIRPNLEETTDGLYVDENEMLCLIKDFADLLTPALLYFGKKNLLFPPRMGI